MRASITIPVPIAAPREPYLLASGRDLRLDLLRGLCVLIVIVDHVAGPSPLYWFTGGSAFFTSAAEGFILISGITAGLVYRRLVARDGLVAGMNKALGRAFSLYLLCAGLTLLVAPVSEALRLPWAVDLDLSRSVRFVISAFTLHRTYPFVDVLLLYTLLFLALPLALLLIEQRRVWVLLSVSWLLWLLYQVYPDLAMIPWQIAGGSLFPFAAWQVLFFTAFVASYHRDRLPQLAPAARDRLLRLSGLAFAGLLALYALLGAQGDAIATGALFDRPRMAPGRLLASTVVFGFLLLGLTRGWPRLSRAFGPLLLPFGRHALYAWTAHILAAVLVGALLVAFSIPDNPWLNAGLQVAAVVAVWGLTKRRFLALTPANRRYWYAAPAALALLALLALQHPAFDAPQPAPPVAGDATSRPTSPALLQEGTQ